MKRTPFTKANFPTDKGLNEHPFYLWLIEKYRNDHAFSSHKFDTAVDWLESIGFDKEKHTVPEDVLECLNYYVDAAHRTWMPRVFHYTFDELFKEIHGEPDGYQEKCYKRDEEYPYFTQYENGKHVWYRVTSKFRELAALGGGIFPLTPANYYVRIEDNGRLFLGYQHIIGGRSLATVTDRKETV